MRRGTLRTPAWTLAAFGIAVAAAACGSSEDPNSNGGGTDDPTTTPTTPKTPEEQVQQILDQRKTDFGEALRSASLKLRDRLPDLAEIKQIEAAPDDNAKKVAYEGLVDAMIASPEFSRVMIKYFRDTFRTGQDNFRYMGETGYAAIQNNVNKDGAAHFAAQVTVEGRSFTELLTATGNTCPTFDANANTFTAAPCALPTGGTAGPTVGVLTDPGLQGQYFANMAFRRVRFIQETFICSKFPAEYSSTPTPMGGGVFTGAQPFASITGKQNTPTARIDFHDTQAVICANCHTTLNHIAPLFLNYSATGALLGQVEVRVPVPGDPRATRGDYLPAAEGLTWRLGKPITDIASLGAAIAEDPETPRCAVNRVWNYAMSRGDIVNDLASVPPDVTDPYVNEFKTNGQKLKETFRAVFKSSDFTKF